MTLRDKMRQDIITRLEANNNAQVKKISKLLNIINKLQRENKRLRGRKNKGKI